MFDVAVIGAGPVGCVTALAHAREGARVLLLEANPKASHRLAGEWLHPPAVSVLEELDVADVVETTHVCGRGFAVMPDDGSAPIVLPYADERGASLEHAVLVERLRQHCRDNQRITFLAPARAVAIDGQRLTYQQKGASATTITVAQIVGAAGRGGVVHEALGMREAASTYSRMAGLLLHDVELPEEGFGHVFLGGPGPVLAYRIDDDTVRMCLDVPHSMPVSRNREAVLWEAFRPVLPRHMHRSFESALVDGSISWAANQNRPRLTFGREGLVMVGDAVGHHHPLTAIGMTLGFKDGLALARAKSFAQYREERLRDCRVPEMLAVALYEVFADRSDEVVAIRRAVYELWRRDDSERRRTMDYLACRNTNPASFGGSFVKAAVVAAGQLFDEARHGKKLGHTMRVTAELVERCRWLLSGTLRLSDARPSRDFSRTATETYGAALKASRPRAQVVEHPSAIADAERRASAHALPHVALERAISNLVKLQQDDGAWEGECIWCPMLPAQYVFMCRITGLPISAERRRRILLQFETTQLADGTWGMHELSEPYLFATVLVYVAARMLGVAADDPLLARAHAFIRREDTVGVPSWGKFWLALVGLYEWQGVNPVLPEVWDMPRAIPAHPANYYCHTRLIYLGMATLYGETPGIGDEALIAALRSELFPKGYASVDWDAARHCLREAEIFTPPSAPLKAMYDALRLFDDKIARPERRARIRERLREHIRFELKSTDDTCISPVNGMLSLIGLWHHDHDDADFHRAIRRFEGWVWEDDVDGFRITGARSASWDSAFAVQALTAASAHFDVSDALEIGDAFLASQQIREPQAEDYERYFRIDPTGGYCFAGVWHGWPVSDCTAEAMIARLEGPMSLATKEEMTRAAEFVLRTECPQGGFGSYEPFKPIIELEWLNPAEMFGDSMTEHPYVECTASCVVALAAFRKRYPDVMSERIDSAIRRAAVQIRRQQRPDGSWAGNWGIHFIYGTLFAIRGLLAAGVPSHDPAIVAARDWLRGKQRADGGFGESHRGCLEDRYVEASHSQVIQTAWALSALIEAEEPSWDCIERAAHYLASRQNDDGSWPKEEPAGVFFHTALLHYERYRDYFPLWALGQFETRRLARLPLLGARVEHVRATIRSSPA